jgi:hypothetical protein
MVAERQGMIPASLIKSSNYATEELIHSSFHFLLMRLL